MISKERALAAVVFATVLSMLAGLIIGAGLGEAVFREDAGERGVMTQCLGKTGWHWECDK